MGQSSTAHAALGLKDADIANVLNYVRNSGGNAAPDTITPADVKAQRK